MKRRKISLINQHSKELVKSGFALIATISVMVLLVMIALAMLSLSTIEMRQGGRSSAQQMAQANARMALMMAIGELQKYAGSDTRVTARADIVKGAVPEKAHQTAVFLTEDWDPTTPNKNRKLLRWLVSRKGTSPHDISDVKSGFTNSDLATLVGAGSVADKVEYVKVEKVSVGKSGAYAYWVGDQGIKACVGLGKSENKTNKWNKAAQLALAEQVDISATKVAGLEDYSNHTPLEYEKGSISYKSLDLLQGQSVTAQLFHDVTPLSFSLLTDPRLGGWARDLSTAFELPLNEFNQIKEFHASSEKNTTNFYASLSSKYADEKFYNDRSAPNLGYLTEIRSSGKLFRGPTWDLLRNHYRFYKKEWDGANSWKRAYPAPRPDSFAARGFLPLSYSHNVPGANSPQGVFAYHPGVISLYGKRYYGRWSFRYDLLRERNGFDRQDLGKQLIEQSPRLVPIVTRIAIGIGLVKYNVPDWKLAISFDPYITIVNPYNVPISFQSVGFFVTKFTPVDLVVTYTDRRDNKKKTKLFSNPFSQTYYNYGAIAFRLAPPSGGGAWVLQPGEVKVISPTKIKGLSQDINEGALSWTNPTPVQGQFSYSEGAGLYWNHLHIKPKNGTTVQVKIKGENDPRVTKFTTTLFYAKDHDGRSRDVVRHLPPRNQFGENDLFDDPFMSTITLVSKPTPRDGSMEVTWSGSTSSIPDVKQADATYLAVLDLKMKTGNSDTPVFWMNPRGKNFDLRDYDATDRISPTWVGTLDRINDLSELALVGDPDGHGFWGDGYKAGKGTSKVVLYEIPQLPMTSLAQMQHADIAATGSGGSLQLGNSFAHIGIKDLTAIYANRGPGPRSVPVDRGTQSMGDLAWAGNEMLWDRYFFSGMNWGNSTLTLNGARQPYASHDEAVTALMEADPTKNSPLMNSRIAFSRLGKPISDTKLKNELKRYDKIAAHLAILGGFNVNSTSVKAWRAIFATLRNIDIYYNRSGSLKIQKVKNAFSRFTFPVSKKEGTWNGGFHELTDQQIDDLAEAMVKQVKERGPFMGLADFVNRRLDASKGNNGTDVGVLGALQAAIEDAGLNDRSDISHPVTKDVMEHRTYSVSGKTKKFSTYVGTPSYIMQADILSAIGSTLRARSDTFIIRAYGEARDKRGRIQAKAWCEAIVQRTPEWMQPTDQEPTMLDPQYASSNPPGDVVTRPWIKNPKFPVINQKFGRRFKILTFRWLNANEV